MGSSDKQESSFHYPLSFLMQKYVMFEQPLISRLIYSVAADNSKYSDH